MKWGLAWRVVDVLLGIAIRADEVNERRKAKGRFRELVEARERDRERDARARAKTVVLPRPPPVRPR